MFSYYFFYICPRSLWHMCESSCNKSRCLIHEWIIRLCWIFMKNQLIQVTKLVWMICSWFRWIHFYSLIHGSCKICLKRLKKGIPKVNCMLFLNHLDYMHGFGLFWKVTLWGLFLNRQNHCKSYWYWVIELWTHWKSKKKKILSTFFL